MTHILVVGSGGREHALAWKLAQSPRVSRISVAPGNGGTAGGTAAAGMASGNGASRGIIHNVDVDATDIVSLLDFAETEGVDLTVVGPEEPLAGGLVDQFDAAGLRIFGPPRAAAMIETSKSYAKELMGRYGVPTAPYEVFTELEPALDFMMSQPFDQIVIKADGLARGKGVFLPRGESDAEGILRALLERDALGRAGRRVLIEKRLTGHELSLMAFTDGHSVSLIPAIRDYKRLQDGDLGPNTGGMGAFAPAPTLTPNIAQRVQKQIIEPTLVALQAEQCCFRGVLSVGIVLTQDGPMALEINARFGDPGAQTVLPLLETDLLDVIEACVDGCLDRIDVFWRDLSAVTVVMCTSGYPERSDPGLPISQKALSDDVIAFHAGTRRAENGTLLTTGGRVLALSGMGVDLPTAMRNVYSAVKQVQFHGAHYRTDIGARALWR